MLNDRNRRYIDFMFWKIPLNAIADGARWILINVLQSAVHITNAFAMKSNLMPDNNTNNKKRVECKSIHLPFIIIIA